MNHFLVKENNVAPDCIQWLYHVYIKAWVVPFKVPDTALCTLWKKAQWRDSSSFNIALHHTLHIWHQSKWAIHLRNSPHLPKFRPGHHSLAGTLGGDKGQNNENNIAVQEAECYMVVEWWNALLWHQHNQDGAGPTQIQIPWGKNHRRSSVTEGYNCSCTEHKDAHYIQHTIINQYFKISNDFPIHWIYYHKYMT